MRCVAIGLLTLLVASFCLAKPGPTEEQWEKFKKTFNKNYASPLIESLRRELFMERYGNFEDPREIEKKWEGNDDNYSGEWLPRCLARSDVPKRYWPLTTTRSPKQSCGPTEEQWERFKKKFNKKYASPLIEKLRRELFMESYRTFEDPRKIEEIWKSTDDAYRGENFGGCLIPPPVPERYWPLTTTRSPEHSSKVWRHRHKHGKPCG